jgi:hypothetical protein
LPLHGTFSVGLERSLLSQPDHVTKAEHKTIWVTNPTVTTPYLCAALSLTCGSNTRQHPDLHSALAGDIAILVDAIDSCKGSHGIGNIIGSVSEGHSRSRDDLEVLEHLLHNGAELLSVVMDVTQTLVLPNSLCKAIIEEVWWASSTKRKLSLIEVCC